MIDLDMKTDQTGPVIEIVQATHSEGQVFFFDSDYDVLRAIIQSDQSFMIMPRAYSLKDVKKAIQRVSIRLWFILIPIFIMKKPFGTQKSTMPAYGSMPLEIRIPRWHRIMIHCSMRLVRGGANIIQTDEPEKILSFLIEKGLHW